jgi:hypothetical protein
MGCKPCGKDENKKEKTPKVPHTFLGRTGQSWMEISCFYLLFYAFMAAIFALFVHVLMYGLDKDSPRFTNYLHMDGPGLKQLAPVGRCSSGCEPLKFGDAAADEKMRAQITAFFISHTRVEVVKSLLWKKTEHLFTRRGMNTSFSNDVIDAFDVPLRQLVTFDMDLLGPCSMRNWEISWSNNSFCVYFALNKVLNWVPITYETPLVTNEEKIIKRDVNENKSGGFIPFMCKVVHSPYNAVLSVFPTEGISTASYPWTNASQSWTAPLVALLIKPRQVYKNEDSPIQVECTADALNLIRSSEQPNTGFRKFTFLYFGPTKQVV